MRKTVLASAVILAFAHTAFAAEVEYGNGSQITAGSVTEDTVVNVIKENLSTTDGYMKATVGDEQVAEGVTLTIKSADRFIGVLANSGATYTNNGKIVVNDYGIGKGDLLVVVNAYGINSATIDAALTAKENGAKVIGVSSVEHASTCPLDHPARHPSKKNLHDIVDCHVDCKVKLGDATIKLEGFEQKIGALSTYANAYVMNSIVVEAINILVSRGINPPVWRSGNCPGGDEWNNQFIERFRGAVRCL